MRTKKNSVAFVVNNVDRTRVLIVRRPSDDEDLPNAWGLPAGSLMPGEAYKDAVLRAAANKLGVKVNIVRMINEGEIRRGDYALHMQEYEVIITNGCPEVPQPITGITQYTEWKWGTADDLVEAAQKGSLCSQLFLKSVGRTW